MCVWLTFQRRSGPGGSAFDKNVLPRRYTPRGSSFYYNIAVAPNRPLLDTLRRNRRATTTMGSLLYWLSVAPMDVYSRSCFPMVLVLASCAIGMRPRNATVAAELVYTISPRAHHYLGDMTAETSLY